MLHKTRLACVVCGSTCEAVPSVSAAWLYTGTGSYRVAYLHRELVDGVGDVRLGAHRFLTSIKSCSDEWRGQAAPSKSKNPILFSGGERVARQAWNVVWIVDTTNALWTKSQSVAVLPLSNNPHNEHEQKAPCSGNGLRGRRGGRQLVHNPFCYFQSRPRGSESCKLTLS